MKKIPDIDKVFKVVPRGPAERPAVKEKTGSAKARKTAARLAAVQVLYQMRLNNQDATSALREYVSHRSGFELDGDVLVPPDRDLMNGIVNGVQERYADIEGIIASALADGTGASNAAEKAGRSRNRGGVGGGAGRTLVDGRVEGTGPLHRNEFEGPEFGREKRCQ